MSIKLPPTTKQILAAVLALIIGVSVAVELRDTDGDGRPDTVTVTVDKRPNVAAGEVELEVPAVVVERSEDRVEQQLRVPPPGGGVDPTEKELARSEAVEETVSDLALGGAVQGFKGCVTRIIPVNYSSRNGAKPTWQVLHYTVSRNRPGWDDVNAIISLFSNPGRQASSNFVIDSEGNCAYIVPIERKAWTQAAGNPWSISYEVIAWGDEPRYLESAGLAKLRSVMRQVAARTGIPLRRGATSGSCTPVRSGIVHHYDFGLCGGGHVDITPFSIAAVIEAVRITDPLTTTERKIVAGVCSPKGTGHSSTYWRARAVARIAVFDRAHRAGKPWSYHRMGARRLALARALSGKGC